MHTDVEPAPRADGKRIGSVLPDWPLATEWCRNITVPKRDFLEVLGNRRSRVAGPVTALGLASLLAHSTALRFRRDDGRFGAWESRASPSAGGMSAIRLLVLPLDEGEPVGIYDDHEHALRVPPETADARMLNVRSAFDLAGATAGTTLQLVADGRAYDGCYEDAWSLAWRDSGALCVTIALVATALSMSSVILGRHGDDIVKATGLPDGWKGVGAVHLTGQVEEA